MKTVTINLYSFSELSKEVQVKVLSDLSSINVDHNWWEPIYDDAANIGLKLTTFDLDRNKHAEGEFTLSANEVAEKILKEHGEMCETYETADTFMIEWQPIFNDYIDKTSANYESKELEGSLRDMEDDFLNSLLEDYVDMLEKECDHLQSEEAILETIELNNYIFEENGEMRNE